MFSITNQREANRDIPRLIDLKQRLGLPWIGLSMEPLLGRVRLKREWLDHIDWVIVGIDPDGDTRKRYECDTQFYVDAEGKISSHTV